MLFQGTNILVVGGAGFVGSNLSRQLLQERPASLVIVDNLLSSEISNVPDDPLVEFVYGSIADDAILEGLNKDLHYVFHLATYHGNQSSIENPLADHDNNTLTSLKLFDRLKSFKKLKKAVYSAAGCAVAEKTYLQAHETPEDAPVSLYHDSPYSISKLIGELYGNYYYLQYGLPIVKARFQNVYGPGEILGAGQWRGTPHTVWRNVAPTFIYKALNHEALPLENGGQVSRDFIYVEDIVNGLMLCATKGEPGEVYNLASGVETTILELANFINQYTENPTDNQLLPARTWDRSGKRFGSTKKSSQELGFEASTSLQDGLMKTVKWTKQNLDKIEQCIRKHHYFMRHVRKN